MKRNTITAIFGLAAAALAMTSVDAAAEIATQAVRTHPSQGDVAVVEGATARLAAAESGMFVGLETSGLTPGHVHTLWLVVINEPTACETGDCTS